jgi:hypothetical protein
MCRHAINGEWECLNPPVASRASHFLVRMTIQSVFNGDANPLATPFHFAAFVHLAGIRGLWRLGKLLHCASR